MGKDEVLKNKGAIINNSPSQHEPTETDIIFFPQTGLHIQVFPCDEVNDDECPKGKNFQNIRTLTFRP